MILRMTVRRKRTLFFALAIFMPANLIWEIVQLPLYTIWAEGWGPIAYAVIHCTAGDVLIGSFAMLISLASFRRDWPETAASRVLVTVAVTTIGVVYTIFSEWFNVEVLGSWAYTSAMPIVPLIGIGFAPLLQWLFIPPLALSLGVAGMQRKLLT
jgi:hypothetical protein